MKVMAALSLVALLLISGCGPSPQTAAGFVVDVQSTSLTEITSFTLRTKDGDQLVFRVGALDLNSGGFPGTHLRELARSLGIDVGVLEHTTAGLPPDLAERLAAPEAR